MIKVYNEVIRELISDDASQLVKTYLNIHRLAHYVSHTDDTLIMFDNALNDFWKMLLNPNGSFVNYHIVATDWHCPKLHYLRHYTDWIRSRGCLPFNSTDRTETWHKPLKASWRASNKGSQSEKFVFNDEGRKLT